MQFANRTMLINVNLSGIKANFMPREANSNILIYKVYSLIIKIDSAGKLSLPWIYLCETTLNINEMEDLANLLS